MNSPLQPGTGLARFRPTAADAGRLVLVGLSYLAAHKLSYFVPMSGGVMAAIWPASGIALAALLLSPRRLWPALLGVVAAVNFTVEMVAGRNVFMELGFLAANLIETGASAWLITRWNSQPVTFRRVPEVLALLVAAFGVNAVSAGVGATAATLGPDQSFWAFYRTWWVADGLGLVLVTPLIVNWLGVREPEHCRPRWLHLAEAAGIFALVAGLVWLFFGPARDRLPVRPSSYMLFIPLVWGALRLGARSTSSLLAVLGFGEVAVSALGLGSVPLGGEGPAERVLRVQLLVGTQCALALLLAASFAERRRSEESLRASETRLRTLGDNLPDSMIYQVVRERDGTMRFVHVSAGAERLNGLAPAEILGNPAALYGQLLDADRAAVAAAEEQSLRTLSRFDVVARLRRSDGEVRWMHIRSQPRRLPDGTTVWEGLETDITDRRRMEESLRISEEKFSKVFRASPVAIVITRFRDGLWLESNAAAEHLLGFRREELIGRTTLELNIWTDASDRERALDALNRFGAVQDLELRLRTRQGSDVFTQAAAELIEIDGESCILWVLADVSARQRIEAELKRVNRALRTISNCNQVLVRATDEPTLLRALCQVIIADGGHRLVWVGYAEQDPARTVRPMASAGEPASYLEKLAVSWADTEHGRGPTGTAIRTGKPVVCHDFLGDPRTAPWVEAGCASGFRSSVALPLLAGGDMLGALTIYSADAHAFDEQEIRLLVELADDLAFGIRALRERHRKEDAERRVLKLLAEAEQSRSALLSILEDQKRGEEALRAVNRRYARHEAALSTLSRSYALRPEDLSAVLREIAEVVARTLEVERVSLWTYNRPRTAICCLDLFERSSQRHTAGREVPRSGHEAYFNAMDSADVIATANMMADPRTVTLAARWAEPLDIVSLLDAPLHSRGNTTGVLCCEHLATPRQWTPDEQTFAVAVANLVSMLFAQLERQQLEAQLRHVQKLEALGTLAGGIAHDFNNILGAIISFAELSRMDHPDDRELQENLGEVLKASNRATGLVRQILAFSRRQQPERKPIALAPVIREALQLMRSTLPATVEIRTELADHLPAVLADATQIHQVMMNLCTNAGHAMRGQTGRLSVTLEALAPAAGGPASAGQGERLRLSVSDTGQGMDAATMERIFDPFFTTKGPGEGTGLGLAVVHGIVQEHGGEIEVESQPGVGTTFRVILPAARLPVSASAPAGVGRTMGKGELILFVDDEESLAEAARRLLGGQGFRVVAVSRPEEALTLVEREPGRFAAVLTDLTMPRMTGIELAQRVHRLRPHLPIFIMTGHAGDLTNESIRAMGLQGLVLKPVNFPALAELLASALAPPHVST